MKIGLIFLSLLLTLSAFAEDFAKVTATVFEVEDENKLAITFEHTPHWHTYWKNPGDAGLATKFKFKKDGRALEFEAHPWPVPTTLNEGDLKAYAYEGKVSYFFDIPNGFEDAIVTLKTQYLICKDICIPGEADLTIDLSEIKKSKSLVSAFNQLPIRLENNPSKFDMTLNFNEKGQLVLHYAMSDIGKDDLPDDSNLLTPYLTTMFTYGHEVLGYDPVLKTVFGEIPIDWNGEYQEPTVDLPKDGIFVESINADFLLVRKGKRAVIFSTTFDDFNLKGYQSFHNFVVKNTNVTTVESENASDLSIWKILLFALFGGFILNFMPCVLPVISLKLFALVAHSDESKSKILKHNMSYTLGVLSTFISLALVIILLKSSGESVGWGFQMQSPTFVLSMLTLMCVMAMNMLGLFEFITPGGRTLGTKELKSGFSGDFLNGVLATILATPCSAPFLGAALGYAFTTSTLNIFLIFTFIGLGLSAPFIITGLIPSLVKKLPRPGAWMEKLKMILGLSLLLTAAWLYDVLASQIDYSFNGIYLNTFLLLLFFAFYFRKNISRIFAWNVLFFILPVLVLFSGVQNGMLEVYEGNSISSSKSGLNWKKWSEEAVEKSKGPALINFTASWCLTCKVNKKVVLSSDAFKKLVKDKSVELFEGDWTKRDDSITKFLKQHKTISVPAYFIKKKSGELIFLGETISVNKIQTHLE